MTIMHNKTLSLAAALGLVFISFFLFLTAQIAFAVPGISSAQYLDADGDKNVDTIRIDFDQNLASCDASPSDFTVVEDGEYSLSVTDVSCAVDTPTLYLDVTNGGPAVSTAGDDRFVTLSYAAGESPITFADETILADGEILVDDGVQPYITSIDVTQVMYEGHARNAIEIQYSESMEFFPNADGVAAEEDVILETSANLGSYAEPYVISGLIDWSAFGYGVDNFYTSYVDGVEHTGNRFRVEDHGKTITVGFAVDPRMFAGDIDRLTSGQDLPAIANAAVVSDRSGNPVDITTVVRTTESQRWDVLRPRVTFAQSCDMDRNGAIDYVEVLVGTDGDPGDEIVEGSFAVGVESSWFGLTESDDGTIDIGEASYSTAYTDCGRLADPIDEAGDNKFGVALNGEIQSTRPKQLVIEHDDIGFFRDGAGNLLAESIDAGDPIDGVNPVISYIDPQPGFLDLESDVDTVDIEIGFSEIVDYEIIDGDVVRVTDKNGDAIDHDLDDDGDILYLDNVNIEGFSCENNDKIVVELNPSAFTDREDNALIGTTKFPLTWEHSFCPTVEPRGTSFISTPPSFDINFLAPAAETILEVGEIVQLLWEDLSTVNVSYVNLWFQEGDGAWQEITSADANDGSYEWTIPEHEEALSVKIELTDLASVIAEDILGPFAVEEEVITGPGPAPGLGGPVLDDDLDITAPGSGRFGLSPLTGEEQEISIVEPGDYITSQSTFTVYYIDEEMKRHPLIDTQTFFTWNDSFDIVKVVTDATLPTLPMSTPMLPKPGTVLVKIQSVNDVYAMLSSDDMFKPELRALIDENQAERLYGEDWADYVIDLPPTLWKHFQISDEGMHIDLITEDLLRREEINPAE